MGQETEVRLTVEKHGQFEVLKAVAAKRMTQVAAAHALGMSVRWVWELARRVKTQGARALVHGNTGRPSNHRLKDELEARILELYREKYDGFNLSHFQDMLLSQEKLKPPCRESLRKLLMKAGLWQRQRSAPKHRQRRPRREYEGDMLQMDGSEHHWFGEDRPRVCLVGAIDDATSEVVAVGFFEAETTEAYFQILKEILRKRGVPREIYSDLDSIFLVHDRKKREEALERGGKAKTQFGRALDELAIGWIPAYSPQAKGRIERLWRTFQDRLLKELALKGIVTLREANVYLKRTFLPAYNRKFKRAAAKPGRVYRQAPLYRQLEGILAWKETRKLPRDHAFRFEGKIWQVLPSDRVRALTGKRIEVRRTLRGAVQAWSGSSRLAIRRGPDEVQPTAAKPEVST